MHLALVISSLQTGGAERVLSQLANAWVDKGHKVTLITLGAPEDQPAYALDPRISLIQLNQMAKVETSFFSRGIAIIKRLARIRACFKAVKPELIISFITVTNILALISSRFLKIPVIVAERTHPLYHKNPFLHNLLRRFTYRWASKVISQTHSASAHFDFLSNDRRVVIPNSVLLPHQTKKKQDVLSLPRQIISVGRLCPSKGFQMLIASFAKVAASKQDLRLTIYGEGESRQTLQKILKEQNLANHVSLPGIVTDIETKLCQGDIFVFPSFYEGFPNALCEAMAVGLPVIASKCSGTIDIVTDGLNGRLFDIGNSDQLTALLEELLEDSAQRLSLSKEAQKVVDRFSETSILQKWDQVINEAVNV